MSNDDPAVFDPNIWYQISEVRVDKGGKDLTHNLVYREEEPRFAVWPNEKKIYWQFVPVDDDIENRWFVRSQSTGTKFHLSACYNPEEKHEGKTGLCMNSADEDSEAQMWETWKWNDGTTGVRFINVDNGTDWWLDCHEGSPVFMNDDIDTDEFKPAQRWLVSSVSAVEEESFRVGDGRPVSACSLWRARPSCVVRGGRLADVPRRLRLPTTRVPLVISPRLGDKTMEKTAEEAEEAEGAEEAAATMTDPRPVSPPAHPQESASGWLWGSWPS